MDSKTPEMILKEARQAKGIPIESVHEATKIPLDVLKAMEEGYTVRALSSPFYRKQFIKMYASFLGIELKEEVFVAPPKEEKKPIAFKKLPPIKEMETPKKGITLTKQQKQQIVLVIGSLLSLLVVIKVLGFISTKIHQHRSVKKEVSKGKEKKLPAKPSVKKKPPVEKSKVVEKPKVKKPEVKKEEIKKEEVKREEIKKEEPKAEPEEEVAPVVPMPVPSGVEEAMSKANVPVVVPEPDQRFSTPVAVSPESGKMVNLTVRAKKKSWLQVKVDGNTVFQSSLQKGAVENWQADDKIELTGNNILFLEFEVNGKMIGNLSRTEGRARKLIVTKDGLSVKR